MPSLLLPRSRFLHVPKTGGNWVSAVLGALFPDARRMPKIHTSLGSARGKRRFTFAFVRHPLTWYQSYFSYKERKGWDPKNDWDQVVRAGTFEEFMRRAIDETPGYYSKLLRRFVGRPGEEIDFIGKSERLMEDLIRALQAAGESFEPEEVRKVPPVNESDYRQHPAVYSDDLAERVLKAEVEAVQRFYPLGRHVA